MYILFVVTESIKNSTSVGHNFNAANNTVSEIVNEFSLTEENRFNVGEDFIQDNLSDCPGKNIVLNSDNIGKHTHKNIIFDSDNDSDSESEDEGDASDTNEYDANRCNTDSRIMFPASNLSVSDVLLMLKGIIIRFNVTRDMKAALLTFTKVLAGPEFESWNYSTYLMSKSIAPPSDKTHKHYYYCETCYVQVLKIPLNQCLSISKQCEKCQINIAISNKSLNYFISLDVRYQLEMLLNRHDIQKHMLDFREKQTLINNNENVISDISDSHIYKRTTQMDSEALTFNFNTDGAQLFKSAKKSLWPLQLHLNELPPYMRFKHIILAGLVQTEKEPTAAFLNLFMSILVKECEDLSSSGLSIVDCDTGTIRKQKVFLLFACVDTVARPKIQNRIQFNGKFGGSWCYHPGKYESGSMRYPLLEKDPELRTHKEHLNDLKQTIKCKIGIRGIKGESVLLELKQFDIVWNLPPDYMHGALLGITKELLSKWDACF